MRNAFSIIELIVVIFFISVLLLLFIPNFSGTRCKTTLSVFTRKLVSDLRYARTVAISKGECTYIAFNLEEDSYRIFLLSHLENSTDDNCIYNSTIYSQDIKLLLEYPPNNCYDNSKNPDCNVTTCIDIFRTKFALTNGDMAIFRSNGTATGGTIEIKLKGDEGKEAARIIYIDPVTGRVRSEIK